MVFRHLRDGRTIVCNKPDFSNRKLSKKQKEHHKRFRAASVYARQASQTNPIYAQLAEGTMKNAYKIALGDWFHAPVVKHVEMRGKTICIEVTDDVMVASVQVMILNETGKAIAKGEGNRRKGDCWGYLPGAERKAVVEAQDLAGNVARVELEA